MGQRSSWRYYWCRYYQDGTIGGRVRGALVGAGLGALPVPGSGWGQAKAATAMAGMGLNPNLAAGIAQTAIPLGLTGFAANQGRGGASAGGVARGSGAARPQMFRKDG